MLAESAWKAGASFGPWETLGSNASVFPHWMTRTASEQMRVAIIEASRSASRKAEPGGSFIATSRKEPADLGLGRRGSRSAGWSGDRLSSTCGSINSDATTALPPLDNPIPLPGELPWAGNGYATASDGAVPPVQRFGRGAQERCVRGGAKPGMAGAPTGCRESEAGCRADRAAPVPPRPNRVDPCERGVLRGEVPPESHKRYGRPPRCERPSLAQCRGRVSRPSPP